MEGILHVYHPKRNLLLFEYTPRSSTPTTTTSSQTPLPTPPNTLLFVGGMYDNFLHPSYTKSLAALFPRHPTQSWSVIQVQLSSNGRSFGLSSLDKDIDEIATAITYVRTHLRPNTPGHIVLIGHSTGCQDTLHYLTAPNPTNPSKPPRPPIQGAILQAPVSDRDAANHHLETHPDFLPLHTQTQELIQTTPSNLHQTTIIPMHLTTPIFGPAPLSITRYLSLTSPTSPSNPQPDDLFSHDLPQSILQTTFGTINSNLLLQPPTILALLSSHDEAIPPQVSKPQLLQSWRSAMENTSATLHPQSGEIAYGNHGLEGDDVHSERAREVDFRARVLKYLEDVVGGVDGEAWRVWEEGKEKVEEREKQERVKL